MESLNWDFTQAKWWRWSRTVNVVIYLFNPHESWTCARS